MHGSSFVKFYVIIDCCEDIWVPNPNQTMLKQLKEWNVIVSCDQLEETFPAAPTLLLLSCDRVFYTCHMYSRHCNQRSNNDHFHP